MKSVIFVVFYLIQSIAFIDISTHALLNSTCGMDKSRVSTVYEGLAAVDTYPWLGMLYYPIGKKRFTTSVVLVTKQMVIAAASDIDKLPKWDFRARTRVVLGQKCGKGNEIRVRDYNYHPDFNSDSHSALAMIQLEVDHLKRDLVPICPPSSYLVEPQFFAMIMSEGCSNTKVRIHKMQYVNINRCQKFYRKSGLDQASLWPTHMACARAVSGGRCLWRSGSLLAVKQDGRWRLMGLSIYGPGCGAPARFLDYGMYHQWVRRSATTIGQPAISRLAENHLVMRRTLSSVQRFGPCDAEETKTELYTDKVQVLYGPGHFKTRYNVTIYDSVEYSCIIFKARTLTETDYENLGKEMPPGSTMAKAKTPKIRLKRWCATPTGMCYGFQHLQIQFYVEINFSVSVEFHIAAYGKEAKIIAPEMATKYANKLGQYPVIYKYEYIQRQIKIYKSERTHYWFLLEDTKATASGR